MKHAENGKLAFSFNQSVSFVSQNKKLNLTINLKRYSSRSVLLKKWKLLEEIKYPKPCSTIPLSHQIDTLYYWQPCVSKFCGIRKGWLCKFLCGILLCLFCKILLIGISWRLSNEMFDHRWYGVKRIVSFSKIRGIGSKVRGTSLLSQVALISSIKPILSSIFLRTSLYIC